jgi:sodium transport system ATP-binding protein
MLATLLRPDSGDAVIDGQSALRDPIEVRRRIGVLSHASGLYPQLTARENIVYFAELHGLDRVTAKARVEELARLLELSEFLDRKAKGFSQGQRLKTALARALVHSPRNLILDEPTNGLDVMAVRNLRALLHRLREQGHCILFSSHVMQEVALLCDEVVVIAQGRVAAAGTVESLRAEAGEATLEDALVKLIGTAEGLN